ncbi:hypothetical protein R3P38DRAFT_2515719, partial [Favolaschia claudopus]
ESHALLSHFREGGGFVSGSTPPPSTAGPNFKPNDLDIYAFDFDEDRTLDLLKNSFQFATVHKSDNPYQDIAGIARTHWLKKGPHVINLMVMTSGNAAAAIFQFHSTIVMNYISGWGVFCAYPELTMSGKSIANPSALASERERKRAIYCFDKYGERGIDHRGTLSDHKAWSSHACGVDPSCPTTLRALHDSHSLFIPFASVDLRTA